MKRYLKILTCFILFFNFINMISYAQTPPPVPDRLQKIKERGILTVTSTGDIPFAYIDKNTGELTGVSGESLKDAVVGVLKGSILESRANKLKEEGKIKDVVLFNTETDLMRILGSGKVDVALTGAVNAQYLTSRDSKSIYKVFPTTEYIPSAIGGVAFPIRKTDISLLLAINEKIDDMRIDGTLQRILKKYGLDENYCI